jgi:hypothetical protein
MNSKLWFGCPKCFPAFYRKGEYECHYEIYHPGKQPKGADPIETK